MSINVLAVRPAAKCAKPPADRYEDCLRMQGAVDAMGCVVGLDTIFAAWSRYSETIWREPWASIYGNGGPARCIRILLRNKLLLHREIEPGHGEGI
jgi:hypothetical protein